MSILVNAYCTVRILPPIQFPHKLNSARDLSDPEMPPHLEAFVNYVLSKGDMSAIRYGVWRHIQRVQHQLSLDVEDENMDAFSEWARAANAICFLPDGSVCSPSGAVLVDAINGAHGTDARLPYPADAIARKTATEKRLGELGVRTPASLPPIIGSSEVYFRPAQEVAKRALALFTVALRAESLAGDGAPIPVSELHKDLPLSFTALTPKETLFLDASAPEKQEIINTAWRYESLYLLLWALKLMDDLALPTQICDVPLIARMMLDADQASLVEQAELRSTDALLDALDLHFRLHWAVHQARLDRTTPPAGLEPGVILERHRALNWLIRFENADWDKIDAPT